MGPDSLLTVGKTMLEGPERLLTTGATVLERPERLLTTGAIALGDQGGCLQHDNQCWRGEGL